MARLRLINEVVTETFAKNLRSSREFRDEHQILATAAKRIYRRRVLQIPRDRLGFLFATKIARVLSVSCTGVLRVFGVSTERTTPAWKRLSCRNY